MLECSLHTRVLNGMIIKDRRAARAFFSQRRKNDVTLRMDFIRARTSNVAETSKVIRPHVLFYGCLDCREKVSSRLNLFTQ